jgi:ATP-binding cassette subfamily C protein CydCD
MSERYCAETMGTLRVAFLSALALELLATLSVALVAVSVGLRLVDGGLDLATAMLVIVPAPEVYLPLRAVAARFHDSAEGAAAAGEIFAVLDLAPDRSSDRSPGTSARSHRRTVVPARCRRGGAIGGSRRHFPRHAG